MIEAMRISIFMLSLCGTSVNARKGNTTSAFEDLFGFLGEEKIVENALPRTFGRLEPRFHSGGNRKDHLILTDYLREGMLKEGIRAAKVRPPFLKDVTSYSGFFEVDAFTESYMFFLFFPCRNKKIPRSKIPVILWLQGGTGSSSMYGAFRGNSPVRMETNGSLTYNKYSWAEKAHLLYFDNPVGAGYSYTLRNGYSTNVQEASKRLYEALRQFLALFKLKKHPLYIASQGFGGKYITSLGMTIHREQRWNRLNLQGIVIGNGYIDPPNMMRYGALMYQLGFFDERAMNQFHTINLTIRKHLRNNSTEAALRLHEQWVKGNKERRIIPHISSISGLASLLNYKLLSWGINEKKLLSTYFNDRAVREALHSGVAFISQNRRCKRALRLDILESEAKNLAHLMGKYRVLLYHGQLSLRNSYTFMLNYLRKLKWSGKAMYKEGQRQAWRVDGEVAGYYKTGGKFTVLLIRNAGQMVIADQPKWAQLMINNFIQYQPLNGEGED